MEMTGGQALAKQLVMEGVTDIFGVPGVQLDWAIDGLMDVSDHITYRTPRHEQATAYMADGYARTTGRIGVAMVVPGPGLLNAMAALSTSTGLVGFYASALVFGISAWSIPAIVAAFACDMVGVRLMPAALGVVTVIFSIGQALAPFVAGKLADASESFAYSLMLAALVSLGGAIGALFLHKPK